MEEDMEIFNDEKLISLAKKAYYTKNVDQKYYDVESLFKKTALNNKERNQLVEFVDSQRTLSPLSMSFMKREILQIIGYKGTTSYASGNTVNREELEAIYSFIKKI
jgi:hypothetical protein